MNTEMPPEQPLTPYEQRLRDEVIYLHFLWHSGPPTLNPNPNSCTANLSRNLHVLHPTSFSFKRTKRNKPSHQNASNTVPSGSGSYPKPHPILECQHLHIQYKVLKFCDEFFYKKFGLDGSQEGEKKRGEEDCFHDDKNAEDSEEFKFFFSLFVEHRELRDLYENNQFTGDFYCLVCREMAMFKGCSVLVQHAIAMSKTKARRAHRAFGLVICKVLGWDMARLPLIVLKGAPLSQSLVNLGETLNYLKDDNSKKVAEDLHGISSIEAGKEGARTYEGSEASLVSDVQWPHPKLVDELPSTSSGWPTLNTQTSSVTCTASAEELARFSMVQLQLRSVEKCKSFITVLSHSESDGDDDSDIDLMDEDESEECEEFKLFLRLFIEVDELRDYYENHYEDGEFCCLVCCTIGKQVWKRFKGCAGLLQHATAISRTKKKKAHRAFGQVICKVLGWDVGRLPSIVLKGEPLSSSLAKTGRLQTSSNEDDTNGHLDDLANKDFRTDEFGTVSFETSAKEIYTETEENNVGENSGINDLQ